MKTNIQETYLQGQEIVVDVVLTAHHMGHFEFSACPIQRGEVPRQECFDENHLIFVRDLKYNAWHIKIRLTIVVTNPTESATPHRSLHVNILSRIVNVIQ